ncbi:MAG: hypothetical protein HYY22_08170 [Thaumarchaeota archaeon]|nr:hypothetical protein [Nitrososphaerota archaeon]
MLSKVVIPAAGLGTRLLTATKETPKEMLPIFRRGVDGNIYVKPMLQAIYEDLYNYGFREFCFIVGKGKRAIEDQFVIDKNYLAHLNSKQKKGFVQELDDFYEKLSNSTLTFVNQPEPIGFGDAVLRAKAVVANEPFLVHAGDDLILSGNSKDNHLSRLIGIFEKNKADAAFLIERKEDPRAYGVVVGPQVEEGVYQAEQIIEKPQRPVSNLAIIAIYVFSGNVFKVIDQVKPDKSGEIQLATLMQKLIDKGGKVYGIELKKGEKRIDIGTPTTYWAALNTTWGACSTNE